MVNESIKEKAKSKAQQRFFGMVDAYKKGEMPNASSAIKKAADGMTKKDVKDFAETKHKGLPNHVSKKQINEVSNKTIGDAIRKCAAIGRDEQQKRIALNVINKLNNEYSFQIKNIKFEISAKLNGFMAYEFYVVAKFDGTDRIEYLIREKNGELMFIDDTPVLNSDLSYVIRNLKAYPRRNLKLMFDNVDELNNNFNKALNESIQSYVVKTMADYIVGKTNSKKANKAIMKLASIQESKGERFNPYYGESDALEKAEKCQENNPINFDKIQKKLNIKKGGMCK